MSKFFVLAVFYALWLIWGFDLVKLLPGDSVWWFNLRATCWVAPLFVLVYFAVFYKKKD